MFKTHNDKTCLNISRVVRDEHAVCITCNFRNVVRNHQQRLCGSSIIVLFLWASYSVSPLSQANIVKGKFVYFDRPYHLVKP